MADRKPNKLIQESSPYLLQHAYNPVNWYPWGEEALQLARQQNKPILVSIGYAACHWCHVMERQSFENEQVATLMNSHFVCIKVDREERPDVDAIYMDAVQTMGIQGGWPLNVFLNPEAKPFYGGTYFPPKQWMQLLQTIAEAYQQNQQELDETAEELASHLRLSDLEKYRLAPGSIELSESEFKQLYQHLSKRFDREYGGLAPAPKFAMPTTYLFLLRYYNHTHDETALAQINLTLRQMAYGGIYDQIGGGFARYSVDARWLVPHFEKMLYDNAQLITLYSEAYQVTKDPLFRQVVYETVRFVERELMSEQNGFYSSLDADTEGMEGKYYTFTKDELHRILKDEEPLFSKYYNATASGNFEHGRNILHRQLSNEVFARENELKPEVLQEMIVGWKKTLLKAREKRLKPALDDKMLCSWNALMLKALADAYYVFGEKRFLDLALRNADFLFEELREGDKLCHTYKNGKATIDGFLEDYALLISALIRLYEVTFNETWLHHARRFAAYTLSHFYDPEEKLFFFTDKDSEKLIARKKELLDNVIPSSNAVMAVNLHLLGLYFDDAKYQEIANAMLQAVKSLLLKEPSHLSHWAILYHNLLTPTAEVAIVGKQVPKMREELSSFYLPNMVLMGSDHKSSLPLLSDKLPVDGKTTIYVCYNKTCQLPVTTPGEALKQLKGWQQESKFPAL
ncbi:thioredoxin domain-containing protein [Pontibacter sp. Tf4]|uniref:thioredoxin domain-containing protein n=1 Tax=Pontibacter sp. Tf4 TaxID=2761620 RepID=UPI0016270F4D|nr:thioredoxin domain-containing protein [Pontibacter sp. Tf4]MBB6612200.1 thioredoxin domain-containing protein [Pontibacter sp. Tf4]